MNREQLINRISDLSIWKKGDQRAPHKPLLILYSIGQLQRGMPRLIEYSKARDTLKELLIDFGPLRKSYHPEQPFVRLVNDKIWDLSVDMKQKHITSLIAGILEMILRKK